MTIIIRVSYERMGAASTDRARVGIKIYLPRGFRGGAPVARCTPLNPPLAIYNYVHLLHYNFVENCNTRVHNNYYCIIMAIHIVLSSISMYLLEHAGPIHVHDHNYSYQRTEM